MAGINIENTGGDASLTAGGDIVGGDKNTTTTTTSYGFAGEEDKQQFLEHIDELRSMVKEINNKVDDLEGLDDDQKEALEEELSNQIKNIRQLKKAADQLEPAVEADPSMIETIIKHLDSVSGMVNKVENLQEKSINFAETVGKILVKSAPILLSARHLFGIP